MICYSKITINHILKFGNGYIMLKEQQRKNYKHLT